MRRKTLTIFIMAIVLVAASAFAYAADTTLEVKAPDKLPAVGETFDVEVDLTGNPGVNTIEFQLVFDGSVLDCTGMTKGIVLKPMLCVTNNDYSKNSAIVGAASTEAAEDNGTVATFRFKVITEPKTDLSIIFKDARIGDENGKVLPFTEKTARITVNGKDPVAPFVDDTGTTKALRTILAHPMTPLRAETPPAIILPERNRVIRTILPAEGPASSMESLTM
ncbi:MAG: hypothetical protein IIY29_06850 [Firmicutes bacterium]|nr:hypothetical protein [Bacillota bacterium]